MSPIQQMLLGVGAVATKTYVDDVFSTYVYEGDGNSSRNITNNIDLLTEGGLVWYKSRSAGKGHRLVDTERGVTKVIESNDSNAEAVEATGLKAFLTNGFTVGSDDTINESGGDQASWSFRKAPGFFDVKTWDGNSTAGRQISHDLGCVPGLIMVKSTNNAGDWMVYHRGVGNEYRLKLNSTTDKGSGTASWNDTTPTSTYVELGGNTGVNATGTSYVGYFFAGGESTAATARSVDFDGSNDYLSIPDSADFNLGTNSFTIEFWVYPDAGSMTSGYYGMICSQSNPHWYIAVRGDGPDDIQYSDGTSAYNSAPNSIPEGQWTHVAFVNNSGTGTWYINGVKSTDSGTVSAPNIPNSSGAFEIGRRNDGMYFNGKISNFRIVKGTAVYTSSFKPPTEPLTNITNTKLLCCNDSSQTGSTVTPGTITNNGSTASTDSPFDDPAGFVFGDAGDQNVIKCGSYTTDSNEDATIDLGWEPQWVLAKRTDSSSGGPDWLIYDSMRGFMNAQDIEANNGGSKSLSPNLADSENDNSRLGLTSTGFYADQYGANRSFIYVAIRRPDGYVGKPPELGTDVFAMDTGSSASLPPGSFDSGFPVDIGIYRQPASVRDWILSTRLTGNKFLETNTTEAESTDSGSKFDSNTGWYDSASGSYQSWMWKRHAGFDVVAYEGDDRSGGRPINHNLSVIPEMMWIKVRDNSSQPWMVYHKDVGHGKDLKLNTNSDESNNIYYLNNTAPTSTHFTVGQADYVNGNYNYIAMLFASVAGISKVGYYAGSNSTQTITTGFQPRFVIIKNITESGSDWAVFDTVRGWGSGIDERLRLNSNAAQNDDDDVGAPTSTGFTVTNIGFINESGANYIYYCHA